MKRRLPSGLRLHRIRRTGGDGTFDRVVVEFDTPIIEESGEGWPARERITNGLGEGAGGWNAAKLHLEPRLHHLDERLGAGVTNMPTRVRSPKSLAVTLAG